MTALVIPAAGQGSRFREKGFDLPKPLIDVMGVPMVVRVMENLIPAYDSVTLIVREEDKERIEDALAHRAKEKTYGPNLLGEVRIVTLNYTTNGAATTIMHGIQDLPNRDERLIVANSDQLLDWDAGHFFDFIERHKPDGCIPTFHASDSKWSYANVNDRGEITHVAEKVPISNHATCGVYYYSSIGLCMDCIYKMTDKEIKTNNEYYFAPTYNEAILDGRVVLNYPVPKMYGLGTPNDYSASLAELTLQRRGHAFPL